MTSCLVGGQATRSYDLKNTGNNQNIMCTKNCICLSELHFISTPPSILSQLFHSPNNSLGHQYPFAKVAPVLISHASRLQPTATPSHPPSDIEFKIYYSISLFSYPRGSVFFKNKKKNKNTFCCMMVIPKFLVRVSCFDIMPLVFFEIMDIPPELKGLATAH